MNGKGAYKFHDGSIYEGTFRNNLPDGFGKMIYGNGDVYEGEFVRGHKDGKGIYRY